MRALAYVLGAAGAPFAFAALTRAMLDALRPPGGQSPGLPSHPDPKAARAAGLEAAYSERQARAAADFLERRQTVDRGVRS